MAADRKHLDYTGVDRITCPGNHDMLIKLCWWFKAGVMDPDPKQASQACIWWYMLWKFSLSRTSDKLGVSHGFPYIFPTIRAVPFAPKPIVKFRSANSVKAFFVECFMLYSVKLGSVDSTVSTARHYTNKLTESTTFYALMLYIDPQFLIEEMKKNVWRPGGTHLCYAFLVDLKVQSHAGFSKLPEASVSNHMKKIPNTQRQQK